MKKIICFHYDNLAIRGTYNATSNYCFYNKKILYNESIVAFPKNLLNYNPDQNFNNRLDIANKLRENYDTIEYDNIDNLKENLKKRNCNYIYFLKSGYKDQWFVPGIENLIHATFQYYEPHGRYAYVSQWLSNEMSKGKIPVVPHIINMPVFPKENFREKYNIPKNKFMISRIGGYDQFDIQFVKEIIAFVVNFDPSIYFVFVNTRKFIEHPQVLFLPPIFDEQEKSNFILSSDLGLMARSDGESFGIAFLEYLYHGIPVLNFNGGRDKNHIEILKNTNLLYSNQYELLEKIIGLKYSIFTDDYKSLTCDYCPEMVMEQFDKVFLYE